MKKIILFFAIAFASKTVAQCTAFSSTASASIYSMTAVYASSMGVNVAICCNGVLYDTLNNNNNMNYFIHPGGILYKKGGVTTMVWMDAGAKLINKGGTSAIMAYSEATSTITNIGMPSVNNTTCTAITIPFANCFPLGGACGASSVIELGTIASKISIHNSINNKLKIRSENTKSFKVEILNIVGELALSTELIPGSNDYDISNLKAGVYFVNIYEKQSMVVSRKIVID